MRLNQLTGVPGATRTRKRVGRGIGSGKGKTAGRGHKGQKSRSGIALKGFEGGQMPIHRRLPKRGFNPPFPRRYNEVNLGRVQAAIDAGKLDPKKPVTAEALQEAGVIRRRLDGVRLLGVGEIKAKVAFEVTGASKPAVAAVEKAGGSVTLAPLAKPQTRSKAPAGEAAEAKQPAQAKTPQAKKPAAKTKAAPGKARKTAKSKPDDGAGKS